MSKSKRGERSSSLSSVEIMLGTNKKIRKSSTGTMEDEEHSTLKDSITSLCEEMRNSFSNLQEEMTKLRLQVREELDEMKRAARETEKSLDEVWKTIDDLKERIIVLKAAKTLQQQELNCLQKELDDSKQKLNEEKEKNIELENYSRRENLKFNNIPEMPGEGNTLGNSSRYTA